MSVTVITGVPVYVRHDRPPVEALSVVDGRVLAVGDRATVIEAAGPGPVVRRLSRGAVMPTFVDPHQHAYLVAADPMTDVLHGAPDIAGLLAALRSLVAAAPGPPAGRWLRFHGYEPLALAEHRSPTATELDRVVPDLPLHVVSRTYHESVVNGAGLEALRITAATRDPAGGRIVRDRRGRPTGVLLEAASFLAEMRSRPQPHECDLAERLAAHGRRLLAEGITRIGDAATPAALVEQLRDVLAGVGVDVVPLLTGARIDEPAIVEGATAKVLVDGGEYCHLCLTAAQLARVSASGVRAAFGPDRAVAAALRRRTGTPRREADGRWHTGVRYPHEADLPAILRRAADAGAGLAAHAVGNGAAEAILRARAADRELAAAVPLRIEHVMTPDPHLVGRLADEGLPVVAQPAFLAVYGHDLEVTPVPEPLRLMPFRTMLDAGLDLAFSSDHPAAPLGPFTGVHAAVTRHDHTGAALRPEEAVTVAEALTAGRRAPRGRRAGDLAGRTRSLRSVTGRRELTATLLGSNAPGPPGPRPRPADRSGTPDRPHRRSGIGPSSGRTSGRG
jgi:predicted amidohydrolase YtcJ